MFDHTKDIPFGAAMMGALYFLLRLGRELPRPRWHLVLLFGGLCGCALGIRVLGMFLIAYAGLIVITYAPIGPAGSWRGALAFVGRAAFALAPAFVTAYGIMPTFDREVIVRSCRTVDGTHTKATRDSQRTDQGAYSARTEVR